MLKDQTHEFEEKLLQRRREIMDWRKSFRSSWQALSEQEKELEESALKENMARDIERFDHRQFQELQQIDEALSRIAIGEYGFCAACEEPISPARLHALPWAKECVDCAEQREAFEGKGPLTVAEQIREGELDDDEICEAVRNEVSGNDKINDDGLKISCEGGLLRLTGSLPDPSQHQLVLEIIHEDMGIDQVIDQIDISEGRWEERTDDNQDEATDVETKETAFYGEDGETDPHAARSENRPLVPPDDFLQDEGL
jgi:RNA polymerase-binding protein DksA